ncbi:MAG: HAD family hydrolase [Candidatus Handelsmanbacteria bacterium]|nr:HAD family hydrolase [Candidatus Handelsmanbacteria bacterium]
MKPPPRILGRAIEVHHPEIQRGCIHHAVFDFDGTLSLMRAGWQEVMITHAVEQLSRTPAAPPPEGWRHFAREYITRLTGEQTIYQMLHLEEQVRRLGGMPRPAAQYKWEFLRRLAERIRDRLEALRQRREPPDPYLVPGSIALLENLARRGVTCYLASGTDHPFVVEEAGLLGVAPYFGGRIYGAQEDYKSSTKKLLIARIIAENQLQGPELVAFGDGYVEIANTKEVAGLAVGAATCEEGGAEWDEWKKGRLLNVGADLLVPNWREADLLLAYLFGEVD